jgi:voltage-dependent calcium channel
VRVAFLIGFFWLLFAILGVQSFKSSFRRQCVWLDPLDPTNLTASWSDELSFCGGHLDNVTGAEMPWVKLRTPGILIDPVDGTINGTNKGKGFLCPRGSLCLERGNPFKGTVNFDNIIHSLELVFVIMGANTFSDLMYYTMGSDYSVAALFFGAGVMILTLWLVNLLIAVITSSFQVIREESKHSAFTAEHEPSSMARDDAKFRPKTALQRYYESGQLVWVVVIAFGLVVQAFRSSDMPESRREFIDIAEIVVTVLLDVDILIRVIVNWREFHRDWRNLFDLCLAVITSIILIPPIRESRAYAWLTIFQILRAYRVVMAVPVTRNLIMLVLGNSAGIANLMLFVFLMTFLVAILAAQLLRGEVPVYDDGELNPISFYTIYNSFLGVYQVLTTEGWTGILYSVTGYTTERKTSWIAAAFLIGWFVLSFFILISMFIAVIQENFDVSEDEKRLEQVKAFLQKRELGSSSSNLALSTIFGLGRARQRRDPLDYGPAMTEMLLKDAVVREFLDDPEKEKQETAGEHSAPLRSATNILGDVRPGTLSKIWGNLVRLIIKHEPNPFYANPTFNALNDTLDARQMAQQAVSAASSRRKAQREYLARHPTYNNSLYLFGPKNRLRRLCQRLVGPARGHERFDGVEPNKIAWYSFSAFIYAAIVAMVIIACITTPLYQKQYQEQHQFSVRNWYVWTDLAFAVLFTFESVVKIIADGLFNTPNAYLRSSWGIVDAAVLITLWINVVTLLVNNGTVSRAIGAFKAFRALRLLNVSNSARDTFHSLIILGWWKLFGVSLSLAAHMCHGGRWPTSTTTSHC